MKHEFALFVPGLTTQLAALKKELLLQEHTTIHRIQHVLRLSVGDALVVFDEQEQAACCIVQITKKQVALTVRTCLKNIRLEPKIHWLLPLLEREPFEDALYALAAMGVTSVTPVITEKSRKKWGNKKERDRAHRIMVAAAEQSKNFLLPEILETKLLNDVFAIGDALGIFFDVAGKGALEVMNSVQQQSPQELFCLIGPEGDLTQTEKEFVHQANFVVCKLTPTVLKASHAVMVGLGVVRSCLGLV
jgi:16S rRNA (uracil1498-N3)-methyltransferase